MNWIKRHKVLLSIVILFLLLRSAYYVVEVIWFRSLIPPAIETEWMPVAIDGESRLLDGCGAASFTLKDSTLEKIKEEGLAFFGRAKEAHPKHLFVETRTRSYGKWKETPLWEGGLTDGGYSDIIGCDSSFSLSKKEAIANAALSSGSYFTSISESGWLLVLPKLKIILFIYTE